MLFTSCCVHVHIIPACFVHGVHAHHMLLITQQYGAFLSCRAFSECPSSTTASFSRLCLLLACTAYAEEHAASCHAYSVLAARHAALGLSMHTCTHMHIVVVMPAAIMRYPSQAALRGGAAPPHSFQWWGAVSRMGSWLAWQVQGVWCNSIRTAPESAAECERGHVRAPGQHSSVSD